MKPAPSDWFLIVAGLFAASGGIFNWDWFMNNRKARLFVTLMGRSGARVFYILLGLILIGLVVFRYTSAPAAAR